MSDPLTDPLEEVLAEFGDAPAPVVALPRPAPAQPAPAQPARPKPVAPQPVVVAPSSDELADLRDGLAGMRTDLRLVPEQVSQAIAGTVMHSVSVALGEVRRPLEGIGLLTEQLSGVLARLDAITELREPLETAAAKIDGTHMQMSRELGVLASDLAALLTRLTSVDGRLAASTESAEATGQLLRGVIQEELGSLQEDVGAEIAAEIERRLSAQLDDAVVTLAEVLMRHQAELVRQATATRPVEPPPVEPPSMSEELEVEELIARAVESHPVEIHPVEIHPVDPGPRGLLRRRRA